jgi:hypothetical protein
MITKGPFFWRIYFAFGIAQSDCGAYNEWENYAGGGGRKSDEQKV